MSVSIGTYNTNYQRHGYWKQHGLNGEVWYVGTYIDGEKVGYWVNYIGRYSGRDNIDYSTAVMKKNYHII